MANLDLSKYGITGVTEILHNPSYDVLFAEETKPSLEGFEKGQVTELGAVNVMTGIYTCLLYTSLSSGLLPSLDSELRVEDAFLVAAFLAAHWLLVHL